VIGVAAEHSSFAGCAPLVSGATRKSARTGIAATTLRVPLPAI